MWGEGDEFRAVFEHQGYTVVWDEATKAYAYARLSADGTELIPTQLLVGRDDPALNGLPQHLRVEVAAEQARQRFERWIWHAIRRRWQGQASVASCARRRRRISVMAPPVSLRPAPRSTAYDRLSDAEAVVPRRTSTTCNGDGYTGYGNNGSVKEYFYDVSGGLLTYTNVVTAYVRMEGRTAFTATFPRMLANK